MSDEATPTPADAWREYTECMQRSREHLGAGIGLGALSLGAAAIGAVCPMCVVAVPALIGSGLWNRHKSKKARAAASEQRELNAPLEDGTDGTIGSTSS